MFYRYLNVQLGRVTCSENGILMSLINSKTNGIILLLSYHPTNIDCRATVDPPAKRHWNGVSLVGHWWSGFRSMTGQRFKFLYVALSYLLKNNWAPSHKLCILGFGHVMAKTSN